MYVQSNQKKVICMYTGSIMYSLISSNKVIDYVAWVQNNRKGYAYTVTNLVTPMIYRIYKL